MTDGRRPWRTGRSVGRTIYDADEHLIGMLDEGLSALAVDAVNRSAMLEGRVKELEAQIELLQAKLDARDVSRRKRKP